MAAWLGDLDAVVAVVVVLHSVRRRMVLRSVRDDRFGCAESNSTTARELNSTVASGEWRESSGRARA
jgi:hypothetical protein